MGDLPINRMSAFGRKLPIDEGEIQSLIDKFFWHDYTKITHK
jgi:hypothetical protein